MGGNIDKFCGCNNNSVNSNFKMDLTQIKKFMEMES